MTLYEMTAQMLALYEMASDPDTDPQAWSDTLEALDGELEDKADSYAKLIAQFKADAAGLKAEEERLYNRRKALENHADNMKRRLQEMMTATGKTKFKTQLFSYGIQKNPASVIVDRPDAIPKNFLIPQAPKLDKNGLKEFLAYNPNCDFAHIEQTESLRIR